MIDQPIKPEHNGPASGLKTKIHARRNGAGGLYIVDHRTPNGINGEVSLEDIIGGFEIKHGELRSQAYWANAKHLIVSKHGPVQLPPDLHAALLRELKALRA